MIDNTGTKVPIFDIPAAAQLRLVPIEERTYEEPVMRDPPITVEEVLKRLLKEAVVRCRSGCCSMNTDEAIVRFEHPDIEALGLEVIQRLKGLGYNVWKHGVRRDLEPDPDDEEGHFIPIGQPLAFFLTFDWRG